ncbi:uncharacterized protein LOC117221311 isoform X1 [Megalopta genalis]|uniref:uncharacterized protein LOC117221311 isoform X1 n=1 Tax=Megalopta genalis TaxID=115081 RepID=UPI001443446F|nr:uncharacterized protein LOC117221311 isoform X1 [Megalopta genalis]
MMAEKKSDLHLNGKNVIERRNNYAAPVRLWDKLEINEWTFSLFLFVMSLTIVLGKLYMNYGNILQPESNSKPIILSTTVFPNISNIFNVSRMPDVSKFNTKHLTATYGWLIKAAISGLIMMGFTWFIIYHDSSIPGINPPSPFSPSKQRFSKESSGVQMNYLFGLLNGILIFIYMCL